MEQFIFKMIKKIEKDLTDLEKNKDNYSSGDYEKKWYRLSGQRSILYICLTAHDNKYGQE